MGVYSGMTEDDILLRLEREDRARTASIRQMLIANGRQDLADDLDRRLKDIATGVDGARNCWHSISPAQRRAIELLAGGTALARVGNSYIVVGRKGADVVACRLRTARALCAHELIAPDGPVFDPEARFVLTERGRFVLDRGRP